MDKPISVAYQWGNDSELYLSLSGGVLWKIVPDIKGRFEVGRVALYRAESPGVGPVPANELQWVEITDDNYKQYPLLELGKVMHAMVLITNPGGFADQWDQAGYNVTVVSSDNGLVMAHGEQRKTGEE